MNLSKIVDRPWKNILLLTLFGNLWIWKIFELNIFYSVVISISMLLLVLVLNQKTWIYKSLYIISLILLLFIQFRESNVRSLTLLSNDEQRLQQQRLKEYPPLKITVLNKTFWIPMAHWFEGRAESIAFFRIMENGFEVVDTNLYFFANHPRQRVGVTEFEKFPYLLLPFFVYGVIMAIKKKQFFLALSIFFPLILLSIIGNSSKLGPLSLFPFVGVAIFLGLEQSFINIQKLRPISKKFIVYVFLLLYLLILVQTYSYAIN